MTPPAIAFALEGAADAGRGFARALGARRGVARPAPDGVGTIRRLYLRNAAFSAELHEGASCRVLLAGEARAVGAAALALGTAGADLPSPTLPVPPALMPGQTPDDALAALLAALGATIRHHAAAVGDGTATEPVHQMRVAVRRLRSAFGLFRRAAAGPELAEADAGLRALMRVLGPARDWDVFLGETGAALAALFPGDARIADLRAAASAARGAAYAALADTLAGPDFRALGIRLAWLAVARDWQTPDDAPDLRSLAARMLNRRWARMARTGADIADLPAPALHALRLHGKRMRYAVEFFRPLFPGHGAARWVRRLAALQERLGVLNDADVAAGLMARLGPAGAGFAGGVVIGLAAAAGARARGRGARAWKRLRRLDPFWA